MLSLHTQYEMFPLMQLALWPGWQCARYYLYSFLLKVLIPESSSPSFYMAISFLFKYPHQQEKDPFPSLFVFWILFLNFPSERVLMWKTEVLGIAGMCVSSPKMRKSEENCSQLPFQVPFLYSEIMDDSRVSGSFASLWHHKVMGKLCHR